MWVYEIGTSPYFSVIAPGEVPDLPTELPTDGPIDEYEKLTVAREPVYNGGQQVLYPSIEAEGGQFEVQPVQYQPHQPGNPEVVVVDDTDINVDGELHTGLKGSIQSSCDLMV